MQKQNILLIMADQLRADWAPAQFAHSITPNIRRIANNGVQFTRCSCNSPLCAPSRASIASGLYPHRTGVLNNEVNYDILLPTYYQKLRQSGYRVGVVGKTDLHKPVHFYGENGDIPFLYELGFTDPHETEGKINASQFNRYEFQRGLSEQQPVGPYQRYLREKGYLSSFVKDYRYREEEAPVWYARESVLSKEDYHDSYIGQKACQFLETINNEHPWHYFVSFVGPHDPWDAPEEYAARFEPDDIPDHIKDEMKDKPAWITKRQMNHSEGMRDDAVKAVRKQYAGMVSLIDEWIGKMIEILEYRNMLHDTIIIITSDHGEMLGDHGLFLKKVMYEPSVRVPLIIWNPGQRWRTDSSDSLVELIDLYPTILDMAGVDFDRSHLDGTTLLPFLRGETEVSKQLQISELDNTRMAFNGQYKYIENYNDRDELYDLREDPYEKNNLIEEKLDIARELSLEMMKHTVTRI